jgi:cathepsin L
MKTWTRWEFVEGNGPDARAILLEPRSVKNQIPVRMMKLLHSARMVLSMVLAIALLQGLATAQTARVPRPITPIAGPLDPAEREIGAPPAILTQLATLRETIQSQGLTFQVGYSAGLDFPVEEITGLQPPANLFDLMQRRADERARNGLRTSAQPQMAAVASPDATSFDWRSHQGSTPVRDQLNCGSCWAFATHGAFEGSEKFRNGTLNSDTSEQDTVDCSGAGNCVAGWWAFDYLVDTGSASEQDYPYVGVQGSCRPSPLRLFNGISWDYVDRGAAIPSVRALKQALCEHGPLAVGVTVTALFQAYTGGVFNEHAAGDINHGVTLIGWDDTQQAWLIKNSWGTVWGETGGFGTERGYMRIAYDSNSIGYGAAWVDAGSTRAVVNSFLKLDQVFTGIEPSTPGSDPHQLCRETDPDDRQTWRIFVVNPRFSNISGKSLTSLTYVVRTLSGGNTLINADNAPPAGGVGSMVTVPNSALGSDGILSPGESFLISGGEGALYICLASMATFEFVVDVLGVPLP